MMNVGPEWRNWQTQETQNLPPVTRRVGSIPSSGTTSPLFRGSGWRIPPEQDDWIPSATP
jgi:hypothetical protein